MIPVYQTRYSKRESEDTKGGNCFQAALASLFELALDDVPDFCNIYPLDTDDWYYAFIEWLHTRGLSAISIEYSQSTWLEAAIKGAIILVTGKNKDGVNHCVLYKDGKPIHNPNKHCKGIKPETIDIIFSLNPCGGHNDTT